MVYKLQDTKTGEVRDVTGMVREPPNPRFVWEEGNYSCDCNRELLFRRAGGEDPELISVGCGDERYRLVEAPWDDPDAWRD